MSLNFNAISGNRPYSPLATPATGSYTAPATPTAAAPAYANSLDTGFSGSLPSTNMLGILGMMLSIMSQLIGMMGGGLSGGSPFGNALGGSGNGSQPSLPGLNDASAYSGSPSGYGGTNAITGTAGQIGTTGFGGITGSTAGQTGIAGFGGITGNTALTGAAGLGGIAGTTGLTGTAGLTGNVINPNHAADLGVAGTTGTAGMIGTSGVTGTAGTAGMVPLNGLPSSNPVVSNSNVPLLTNAVVGDNGSNPLSIFTTNDYKNFLLAGSMGGTQGTSEGIFSKFADPNSRFARTGNAQFQAAIAGMYANQFKGYAMGLDVAFAPGKDINTLANNLVKAGVTRMTPEAEMLSKVASLYRGELTGVNLYNNPSLKQLLINWGRTDIASQPDVGSQNGDVQSIGGVVKALNEQNNATIRQQWLQQIFDFAGNTPKSPSGAVPNLQEYQQAISLVRSSQFNLLLNQFLQTPGD